jgi:hypothetical protein
MKKIILFTAFMYTFLVNAQVPQKMSYQAVVRNSNNQLIQNNAVGMRISILQGSENGNAVYVETHVPIANGNGSVTIEIGNGTVVSGVFSAIDWSNGLYWIQTEVDPQGANGYSITGVSQLLTVPFAFYSDYSSTAGNGIESISDNGNGTLTFNYLDGSSYTTGVLSGLAGANGLNGQDGLSAYQIWVNAGNTGTEADFLNSLQGSQGLQGVTGMNGINGQNGVDGLSAYQIWINSGNTGTEADFLISLQGSQGTAGTNGIDGLPGLNGINGLSAYQIWINSGNTGTEADFLNSLQGAQGLAGTNGVDGLPGLNGINGLSAYQIWINSGNTGTESDFLNSLKGSQGAAGTNGIDGLPGLNGINGLSAYQIWINSGNTGTEADFLNSLQGAQGLAGTNGVEGLPGLNGLNTLVLTTDELAGVNCPAGGIKLQFGLDINNNGVLDVSEINSSLTKYTCNGGLVQKTVAGTTTAGFAPSNISGSGFTVTRTSTGTYQVTFATPFTSVPTVVASIYDAGATSNYEHEFVKIRNISTTGFTIKTMSGGTTLANAVDNMKFSFIAIGL